MSEALRNANDCHYNYYGWDSETRNGYGDYIPRQCPQTEDDHCENHCPNTDNDEDEPVFNQEEGTVTWDLICAYCDKDNGEITRAVTIHYDKV